MNKSPRCFGSRVTCIEPEFRNPLERRLLAEPTPTCRRFAKPVLRLDGDVNRSPHACELEEGEPQLRLGARRRLKF
jgi:hypothetical protein